MSTAVGTKRGRDDNLNEKKSAWLHSILLDALVRRDQTHRGLNALTRLRTPDNTSIGIETRIPTSVSSSVVDAVMQGRPSSIPGCWTAKCHQLQSLLDESNRRVVKEEEDELDLLRNAVLGSGGDMQQQPTESVSQHSDAPIIAAQEIAPQCVNKLKDEKQEADSGQAMLPQSSQNDSEIENHSSTVNPLADEPVKKEEEEEMVPPPLPAPAGPRNPKSKLGKLILHAKKKLGVEESTSAMEPIHTPQQPLPRRTPLSSVKSSDIVGVSGVKITATHQSTAALDNSEEDEEDYPTSSANTIAAFQQQPNKQLSYEEFLRTTHKRAPRKGEIGITAEEIQSAESLGYVMSGSRNRNVQKTLDSKQKELHEKQADKDRLVYLAEEDRRKDAEAVSGLLDLF